MTIFNRHFFIVKNKIEKVLKILLNRILLYNINNWDNRSDIFENKKCFKKIRHTYGV